MVQNNQDPEPSGEVIIYQTEDGLTRLSVSMENETVWLTAEQMSRLFDKAISTIREHIGHIFTEGELIEAECVRKIGISDYSTKPTNLYNLDVIISVGYRVKSKRGTQFRIWANKVLKEYLIKGFAMDDERLKGNGGGDYWKELFERIKDIRSSRSSCIVKCSTSTQPPSTMTQRRKSLGNSLQSSRTSYITPRMVTLQPS